MTPSERAKQIVDYAKYPPPSFSSGGKWITPTPLLEVVERHIREAEHRARLAGFEEAREKLVKLMKDTPCCECGNINEDYVIEEMQTLSPTPGWMEEKVNQAKIDGFEEAREKIHAMFCELPCDDKSCCISKLSPTT